MATSSSIFAWRIPWTGEPGRIQCTGSQSQAWLKRLSTHPVHLYRCAYSSVPLKEIASAEDIKTLRRMSKLTKWRETLCDRVRGGGGGGRGAVMATEFLTDRLF